MVRAIGRQYGHELKLTGCYEFTYRLSRVLGKPKQAEYYVRDILLSHASRHPSRCQANRHNRRLGERQFQLGPDSFRNHGQG